MSWTVWERKIGKPGAASGHIPTLDRVEAPCTPGFPYYYGPVGQWNGAVPEHAVVIKTV